MRQRIVQLIAVFFLFGLISLPVVHSQQPGNPGLQEKLAAVKQAAGANQQAIHQYQWVETTQVSLKGEVKSTKQSSCLYGSDGKVQKTPIETGQPQQQDSGGRHGRAKEHVIEKKKDELSDYMDQVKAVIALYVPPDPNRMQMASQAGNVSLNTTSTPGIVSLVFKNYAQPGDSLTLSFEEAQKKIASINVNTYTGDPKDVVTLTVEFASLPDGTSYPGQEVLVATAKQIQVTITNGNYQKLGS
jgi:hypothetical protein